MNNITDLALTRCGNLHIRRADQLVWPVPDVNARVSAGEPMPAGECPDCGVVAHLADVDPVGTEPHVIIAKLFTAVPGGESTVCSSCGKHGLGHVVLGTSADQWVIVCEKAVNIVG